MTLRQIIDRILEVKELPDDNSLAIACGILPNTLAQAIRRGKLGTGNIQKIHDHLGISMEFLKTGKGVIIAKNGTAAIKKEQADILDNPLVKNLKKQIDLQEEIIQLLRDEIGRLKGGRSGG